MSALRWLLAPFAPLYGLVVALRNRAFDRDPRRAARVEAPVVSIGNLSMGGTGKTPVTLFLARTLEQHGLRTVVLSRGYGGRRHTDPMDVQPDSDPRQTGDEPLLMSRALGTDRVVVGRSRLAAALRALGKAPTPDVLLLDDGFQHRALHRDLDLLLLDGVKRWGNGRQLPLGDLREPMSQAARAHALVVTRGSRTSHTEIEAWWAQHGSGGPIFYVDFAIRALRHAVTGSRVEAPFGHQHPFYPFCALGHPEAFYADLLLAGLHWQEYRSFRDHRALSPAELREVDARARLVGAEALVCTEKDAVKLTPAHLEGLSLPLYIAEQHLLGGEALAAFVRDYLSRATPRAGIPAATGSAL